MIGIRVWDLGCTSRPACRASVFGFYGHQSFERDPEGREGIILGGPPSCNSGRKED